MVNKLESKFCERVGCHYPQTQLAFEELKNHEEAKLQTIRDELSEMKAAQQKEIYELNEKMDRLGDMMMELNPNVRYYRNEFGWYTVKYEHPLKDEEKKIFDEGVAHMEQARKKADPVR